MLSSGLPPDITVQGQQGTWYSLHGLNSLTYLDLGGSHFSAAVWVAHMCPLLASMTSLQRLMLAHCSIPPGKMQYLLPTLTPTLVEINMDRCGALRLWLYQLVICRRTRWTAAGTEACRVCRLVVTESCWMHYATSRRSVLVDCS